MLQNARSWPPEQGDIIEESGGLDLDYYIAVARRRARLIIACALAGLVVGCAHLSTAVPLYTAGAQILVGSLEGKTAQQVAGVNDVPFESDAVDSMVQLIRSEAIAEQVIDALDLANDPTFMRSQAGAVAIVAGWLGDIVRAFGDAVSGFVVAQPSETEAAAARPEGEDVIVIGPAPETGADDPLSALTARKEALARVRDNLNVNRVARTFVLDIAFTAPSPELAARIANGYAKAYLDDQLESKYQATQRASDWLLDRSEELRQQLNEAERAVEEFRRDNNLIASNGTLIADRELSSADEELNRARADVAQVEANYQRLQSLIDSGEPDAVVSETFSQGITSSLRTRYLEASKRESEISALLGPQHVQALRLRDEMSQLQRLMFEEVKRVAQVTGNDLEVARQRVRALERRVANLIGETSTANETQIQLRELDRKAESIRGLHSTFRQRYQESLQTQSFPINDARIITPAAAPDVPSYPRRGRTLILALFLGGAFGVGMAAFAEHRDRVFRTGEQVRDELGLEFIGMLPIVAARRLRPQDPADRVAPSLEPPRRRGDLAAQSYQPAEPPEWPPLAVRQPIMQYVLAEPLSSFAETLRSAKIAADVTLPDRDSKVIGIASVLPNEGKTTIAKNYASLLTRQGGRTLLIDGDLRNPALTRACARDAERGLAEVLTEDVDWRSALRYEGESGLFLLPTVAGRRLSHTGDLLSSPAMKAFLADAQTHFDYIIVDLPPLGAVVDVRAMLPLLGAVLFIVEWGKTKRKIVRESLLEDRRLAVKSLGVIFNKVDKDKLRKYSGDESKYYYYNRYTRYYKG